MWRNWVCAGLLVAGNAWAGSDDIIIDKVFMRESVPGQTSATVQLNLSVVKPARLLSVSSPVSDSGRIEDVVKVHGKLQTKVVGSMKLPAHSTTLFGARGIFLTLVGLKQPLFIGDKVPVTLVIEQGGKQHSIEVTADVKALELSYQHYKDPHVKDHR